MAKAGMLIALTGLLAGCGAPASSTTAHTSESFGSAETTVADALFRLAVHADQATYQASDAIAVHAVLTYTGTDASFVPAGSGEGLVAFSLRQLDGTLDMEAAVTADCVPHPMTPGVPQTIPFFKSGAWEPEASDAGFWSRFFADPVLHLPPGRWAIIAQGSIRGPECAPPQHDLTASVEVTVLQ
jgi:hypothetical protein